MEGHIIKNQVSIELLVAWPFCYTAFYYICVLNKHPGLPCLLKRHPTEFSWFLNVLFLFTASFNAYNSKEMHTTCLKRLTDHLLLIGGGWRTKNFPWDLTFFARMKNCCSGQDSVISPVAGAYSRSLLRFTCGVILCSEEKFVTASLTDKVLENI